VATVALAKVAAKAGSNQQLLTAKASCGHRSFSEGGGDGGQ